MTVHIIRDFSNVNEARYNEAISKQLLACPRVTLRNSQQPSDSIILPSTPIQTTQIEDTSKDMFESSSNEDPILDL